MSRIIDGKRQDGKIFTRLQHVIHVEKKNACVSPDFSPQRFENGMEVGAHSLRLLQRLWKGENCFEEIRNILCSVRIVKHIIDHMLYYSSAGWIGRAHP